MFFIPWNLYNKVEPWTSQSLSASMFLWSSVSCNHVYILQFRGRQDVIDDASAYDMTAPSAKLQESLVGYHSIIYVYVA